MTTKDCNSTSCRAFTGSIRLKGYDHVQPMWRSANIHSRSHVCLISLRASGQPAAIAIRRYWISFKRLLMNKKRINSRRAQEAALKKESERVLVDQIRRLL